MPLDQLPADHPAHDVIAAYLAQLCHSLFAMTAVEAVVLGGGVMNTPGLLDRVTAAAAALGNGYLPGSARHHIAPPATADAPALVGALALAAEALNR